MPLSFESINPNAGETILLLHGLFSSGREYAGVVPHLSKYHLLIPDLPGHAQSSSTPITKFDDIVTALYELVIANAHSKKVHVVGLSFGGYLTLTLAAQHPEIIRTCWVTGCCQVLSGTLGIIAPYLVSSVVMPMRLWPGMLRWAADKQGMKMTPEYANEMIGNMTWTNSRSAYGCLAREYKLEPVAARTLAVAAGKDDPVNLLPAQVEVLQKGNKKSSGAVARGAVHAWDLQFPDLFAAGIVAWIEEKELPDGLVDLDKWNAEQASKKKGWLW